MGAGAEYGRRVRRPQGERADRVAAIRSSTRPAMRAAASGRPRAAAADAIADRRGPSVARPERSATSEAADSSACGRCTAAPAAAIVERVVRLVIGGGRRERHEHARNAPRAELRDRHRAGSRERDVSRRVRVGDRREIRAHPHAPLARAVERRVLVVLRAAGRPDEVQRRRKARPGECRDHRVDSPRTLASADDQHDERVGGEPPRRTRGGGIGTHRRRWLDGVAERLDPCRTPGGEPPCGLRKAEEHLGRDPGECARREPGVTVRLVQHDRHAARDAERQRQAGGVSSRPDHRRRWLGLVDGA